MGTGLPIPELVNQTLALAFSRLHLDREIRSTGRLAPYYGRLEEERKAGNHRSRYHEGLMTSRALASHELVLLMGLVDCLLGNRIGFPAREQPAGMLQSPRVLLALRSPRKHRSIATIAKAKEVVEKTGSMNR